MQRGSLLADSTQKNIAPTDSIETHSTSNQRIIEDSIKIFAQQLEKEWNRQRAPQRLREKLLGARTSEATVTARIFLDHGGFKTWMAYFLATEGRVHFKGRYNRMNTIASFQKLSLRDRINAARRVAGIQPHPTAHDAIRNISEALIRDRKSSIHSTFLLLTRWIRAPGRSSEEQCRSSTKLHSIPSYFGQLYQYISSKRDAKRSNSHLRDLPGQSTLYHRAGTTSDRKGFTTRDGGCFRRIYV
jgi:hypothetical protein